MLTSLSKFESYEQLMEFGRKHLSDKFLLLFIGNLPALIKLSLL